MDINRKAGGRGLSSDPRFKGIRPFEKKVWLSSPTMHGEELAFIREAYEANWMSTVGENIDVIEKTAAAYIGRKHAVALGTGTAALHLAVKLAAERLYQSSSGITAPDGRGTGGCLAGRRVFCSDMTFAATVNPVLYEGGEAVFIDTERGTWNMDPEALERAFEMYPEVKLAVVAHLYGTPGKIGAIREICGAHGALLIEDAAESLGAVYKGKQTGTFGDYSVVSFNGNKIITGSSGGMLLTDDGEGARKARKWSTQSREAAPWYEHEGLGYNYRMSNVIAGVVRGQFPHLEEHIEAKRKIYERYKKGLSGLPAAMNPWDEENSVPNFWLSCLIVEESAMCRTARGDRETVYETAPGKSCPDEILEALKSFNAEGRPIWKPMHMQPMYRMNPFVTVSGSGRGRSNAYLEGAGAPDAGADIFRRGLCLPSDHKMTEEEQERVMEIVRRCFE